nr:uncharacterized protein LOC121116302 [Lepeophtheirus salmonis]
MSLAKGDDETEFFNTSSSITLGPNTVDDDIWSRAYAPKEVDPMVYNISCCYLGIIGVVGILGNGYSITLYISRKKAKQKKAKASQGENVSRREFLKANGAQGENVSTRIRTRQKCIRSIVLETYLYMYN